MTTEQYLILMGTVLLVPTSVTVVAWFCLKKLDETLEEWMNSK